MCIPYAEDIIIEADEAWAIPMSLCEGIFSCGEAARLKVWFPVGMGYCCMASS